MCVCMCVYIYIYIYICVCVCVCVYIYIYIYIYIHNRPVAGGGGVQGVHIFRKRPPTPLSEVWLRACVRLADSNSI